jgi:uncharacterized repeat protein (TIGR03803 family)
MPTVLVAAQIAQGVHALGEGAPAKNGQLFGCIMPRMRMLRNSTRILAGAFILSLALTAQTFTTLYTFNAADHGAYGPYGGVILGPDGELYGATQLGGEWNLGTVYELLPPASTGGPWTEVVLHSFNGEDGEAPGPLVMGPAGSLYGVTQANTGGYGIVFQLDPPTGVGSHWPYTVIHRFTQTDGSPFGALVIGSPLGDGQSLYGTGDYTGGFTDPWSDSGCETLYRLTPPPEAGGAWTYTILYNSDIGNLVEPPLAVGAGGTLFGVTEDGGYLGACAYYFDGCGTVFSLTPPAIPGGSWTKGILHAFNPGAGDGNRPLAGVILGPGGVLYGTTQAGGEAGSCSGIVGQPGSGGTVFSLTPPAVAGAPMTDTILHEFGSSEADGCVPAAPLVLGPNGVLYGTTLYGGANSNGTVFALVPPATPGGSWTETIVYSFGRGSTGSYPGGFLTIAPDGTLFGTTPGNTPGSPGTVFAITP